MSALRSNIEGWQQEGTTYSMDDKENWALLNLGRGDFVEVPLSASDWEPRSEAQAGFLVMDHMVTGDSGMALMVHGVGCTDPQLNK